VNLTLVMENAVCITVLRGSVSEVDRIKVRRKEWLWPYNGS
jgi:hypothetical protein